MEELPEFTSYLINGVHGGVVLVHHRQVYLLLTGDLEQGVALDDQFFARLVPGRGVEFTKDQLRSLRDLIDLALDGDIDPEDDELTLERRAAPGAFPAPGAY